MHERWFMMPSPNLLNAESFGGSILACVTMARGQHCTLSNELLHCNKGRKS
jgi:hypothetical protein